MLQNQKADLDMVSRNRNMNRKKESEEGEFRSLFLGMENTIHLAACSQAPMLKTVWRSQERYLEDIMEFGNPWELWSEKVEELRSMIARIISAHRDEVAITFSVSSAFSALLSGFGKSDERKIVTSDLEYPTTNYIVLAQAKNGWKHETVKHRNGMISKEQYASASFFFFRWSCRSESHVSCGFKCVRSKIFNFCLYEFSTGLHYCSNTLY